MAPVTPDVRDQSQALLAETLGWLKAYGFRDKPGVFNGLIGRIERHVGTGWEALGATPPARPQSWGEAFAKTGAQMADDIESGLHGDPFPHSAP